MVEREASTKDQLIDSTRELLWERGYAATSPRAILGRAGVGQGSMYHHFASKRQLAEAALGVTARELLQGAEAVLGEGDAFDRVVAYLLRQRDVLRGCPVGRMASDPDVLGAPELREIVATTFEHIRTLLAAAFEQGIANGEITAEVDPAQLSETVLAVVQGGYVLARAAADPAAFDRAVRGAVALIALARVQASS